jgi:hypothetical protein
MAVVMLSFAVTLEAQVAPQVVAPQAAAPHFDTRAVNRAVKGDRLPFIPTATGGVRPIMAPGPINSNSSARMCPPRTSHDVFAPEVAGRCLA